MSLTAAESKVFNLQQIDKSDWSTYKFGDIAFNISERIEPQATDLEIYVGLEHLDSGDIHIRRKGTPSDVKGTKLKVYKGDVIFGKRRAYQRKAGVADFDGICSAHAMVIRANPETIVPDFFPFFVHSDAFMNRAVEISEGSLSPTIKWKTLKEQEFKLPPRSLQEEIANLLLVADVVIEKSTASLWKYDQLFKTLVNSISNELSDKQDIKYLGDVVEIMDNKRVPLNQEQRSEMKGEVPYFGSNGVVDWVNDYLFDEELVLISEDGGYFAEHIEKPIAYVIEGKSWVNNHVHVLKAKECIDTKWLYYSLVHKNIQKFILGSTRTKLNKGSLVKIKIWVPSLDEQKVIVSKINNVESCIELSKKKLSDAKLLLASILKTVIDEF